MAHKLSNFRSVKQMGIHGSTLIPHKVRMKLGLSNETFTVLDLVHKLMIQDKEFNQGRLSRWIGMTGKETIQEHLMILLKKKLIEKNTNEKQKANYNVTKMYQATLNIEIEDDFEFFWRKENNMKWQGSKGDAKKLFMKAAEQYGSTYVIQQKRDYFAFLAHPDNAWRKIMMATVFLNVSSQRFNEPWKEYLEDVNKSRVDNSEVQGSTMTMADKEKQFE